VASPVAQRADELGVPVLKPAHPRDPEFQQQLRDLAPDCCPVVAYGALLPQSALDIPVHGWVNLHFSCLPHWRGAAPVQHAIWAGDEVTGATTFRIVKELDAGPVFGVMTERIRPTDTAGDLLGRLAEGGAGLLVTTLDHLAEGTIEARPQQAEGVSLAPKIRVEDARVDWTEPAAAVDRRIRACTPGPGAWSTYAGERIKLGPVTLTDTQLPPGVLDVGKNHVLVGTGTQAVRLGDVKAHGRKLMAAADWGRGARLETGAEFGES
jgi:methionyl-tRNA formyltransferase